MQPIETMIPTPNGFKMLKNISVGDSLFNREGKEIKVTEVLDKYMRDIYQITFSDGRMVECDSFQKWLITSKWSSRRNASILTIDGIEDNYKTFSENDSKLYPGKDPYHYKYKIPAISTPVEYTERKLYVDPYIIGAFVANRESIGTGLAIKSNDRYVPEVIAKN